MLFLGGALTLKSEPLGRASNLRLAQNFRKEWVSSPSTGGDGGNRTHVRKSIHTGVSERRRLFKFPYTAAKRQAAVLGSSQSVTAAGAGSSSLSPLKRHPNKAVVLFGRMSRP